MTRLAPTAVRRQATGWWSAHGARDDLHEAHQTTLAGRALRLWPARLKATVATTPEQLWKLPFRSIQPFRWCSVRLWPPLICASRPTRCVRLAAIAGFRCGSAVQQVSPYCSQMWGFQTDDLPRRGRRIGIGALQIKPQTPPLARDAFW